MHTELETKNLVLAETPVALYSTPDGRLRGYEAWVGSVLPRADEQELVGRAEIGWK